MEEKKSFVELRKREIVIAVIAIMVVIGVSFAWLTQRITNSRENVIVAGKLQLTLNNESPILKLGGGYGYGEPLSDASGLATTPYTFTIQNSGTEEASYELYFDDATSYKDGNGNTINIASENRISDTKIDYNLRVGTDTNSTVATLSSLGNPRLLIGNQILAAGASRSYTLRIWIDKSAVNSDVYGKVFAGKLRIEATQGPNSKNPVS